MSNLLVNLLQGFGSFGVSSEELAEAKLIDTHEFVENGLTYEQKVYRLSDNTIYTTTKLVKDENLEVLQQELDKAVREQRFEDAAILRDKIKSVR